MINVDVIDVFDNMADAKVCCEQVNDGRTGMLYEFCIVEKWELGAVEKLDDYFIKLPQVANNE